MHRVVATKIACVNGPLIEGHCNAIWQLYKKLEGIFGSIEFQNYRPGFVIEDYLKVLKLFPAAWRYGWHVWKRIETLNNWPILSSFDATCSKIPQEKIMVTQSLIKFV